MYSVASCHHLFCQLCLKSHVQSSIGHLTYPSCPDQYCKVKLNIEGTFFKTLPHSLKNKVQKIVTYRNNLDNPNNKPCQKPDCQGIFDLSSLTCHSCRSKHCKTCLNQAHEGNCQSNVAVSLQMTRKYRQCGSCGQII